MSENRIVVVVPIVAGLIRPPPISKDKRFDSVTVHPPSSADAISYVNVAILIGPTPTRKPNLSPGTDSATTDKVAHL